MVTIASSTQTRGVVHVINSTEDIDWLQRYGDKRGYIVVMEDRLFNKYVFVCIITEL